MSDAGQEEFDALIETCCEVMHDAYEEAAAEVGWKTQERSRKPWCQVPEANKAAMRAAVEQLIYFLDDINDEDELATEEDRPGVSPIRAIENAIGACDPDALLTNSITAAEWLEPDGSYSMSVLMSRMPPWKAHGLLHYASQQIEMHHFVGMHVPDAEEDDDDDE